MRGVGRTRAARTAVVAAVLTALVACTPAAPEPPASPTAPPSSASPGPALPAPLPGDPLPGDPSPSSPSDLGTDAPSDVPGRDTLDGTVLRWADGTAAVPKRIDPGTAERRGKKDLEVVHRFSAPLGRGLQIHDVADDGTVLVDEGTPDPLQVIDGEPAPSDPVEPSVLRVDGPRGSRTLTTGRDSERVYAGRISSDGTVVWLTSGTGESFETHGYRAAPGRSRGEKLGASFESAATLLDDGVVTWGSELTGWDGTTRTLGLPGAAQGEVTPLGCEASTCPLVFREVTPDGSALTDAFGLGTSMTTTISRFDEGEVTPLLTINGDARVAASLGTWLAILMWTESGDFRTWLVDTEKHTAHYVDNQPLVVAVDGRFVWGEFVGSSWNHDPAEAVFADIHTFDPESGDLVRYVLDDQPATLVTGGKVLAWVDAEIDGAPGSEGVVVRLPKR